MFNLKVSSVRFVQDLSPHITESVCYGWSCHCNVGHLCHNAVKRLDWQASGRWLQLIWRRLHGHHSGFLSLATPVSFVDGTAFLLPLLSPAPPLPFLVNFSYLSELKKLYSLCPFKKNSIENLNLGNWKITSWSFEPSICFNYKIFKKPNNYQFYVTEELTATFFLFR